MNFNTLLVKTKFSPKFYIIITACTLSILTSISDTLAFSLPPTPTGEPLDCKSSDSFEERICEIAEQEFFGKLREKGISLARDSVMFSIPQITAPRRVNTGHSCTHRAWIGNSHLKALLSTSGELEVDGNILSRPLIFYSRLPTNVNATINLKESWGYRSYRRSGWRWRSYCREYATDTYKAVANVSSDAIVRIVLSLNPEVSILNSGDYLITIVPETNVRFSLSDVDFRYDFTGRSPFNGFLTHLSTSNVSLYDRTDLTVSLAHTILNGDSISDELKQRLQTWAVDRAVAYFQVVDHFGASTVAGYVTERIVNEYALDKIAEKTASIDMQLQESIEEQIKRTLNLNWEGKRSIIIPKEIIDATCDIVDCPKPLFRNFNPWADY